ncbi:hypothetical protein FS837_001489 [Tulasnella sp. UAMH 9824]|nr:hypothetical protein FS837_001489 [Tulasnella sp. UAMH 9824]
MDALELKSTGQDTTECLGGRDLPVELWITIAHSLRLDSDHHFPFYPVRLFDMPALKSLRLVSRALNDVTEPLYWERVELSANARPREAMEVVKHLKANTTHQNYVKHLVLERWRAKRVVEQKEDGIEATSEELSELFTSLRNLRAIHFDWVYLTPEMLAHIFTLPKLQSLRFLHLPTVPQSVPLSYGNLPVSSVSLEQVLLSQSTDSSSSLNPSTCINLFVNPASLEKLRISFWVLPIIYNIAAEVPFSNLQTLETPEPSTLPGLHRFYNFARSCQSLTRLTLSPMVTDPVSSLDLIPPPPSDVLGQLQSFQGTLTAAAQIVPTRPVEELYVNCRSENAHSLTFGPALQRCSTSSKAIRVFHLKLVELREEYLPLIVSSFPLLEELEIGLTGHIVLGSRKNGITLHVDQLQPLSRLRSFTLKNTVWDANDRRVIPEPFPTMKDGPSQLEVMKVLTKDHGLLKFVEIGQTVRWHWERDGWRYRSLGECVVVNL